MGASDKETCFWTFCSWSRVTFKEFRNCVTGKTLDGLLVMTRGDSVVVRLEGVTEPILNMTSVVLLDDSTDAATAGLVWVAFFEIVTPEDFPGVASFGGFGVVMIREGFLVGVGGPPEKVGSRENSSMTDYSARKVFHMAPNGKSENFGFYAQRGELSSLRYSGNFLRKNSATRYLWLENFFRVILFGKNGWRIGERALFSFCPKIPRIHFGLNCNVNNKSYSLVILGIVHEASVFQLKAHKKH